VHRIRASLLSCAFSEFINALSSMPTQNTRLHIARKVNFAIQLLREAAELMEASHKTTPARPPHYPRRQERDE
jgi:hypothetical protein